MLTKQQLKIFGVFKKNLFVELTFSQIKSQSRQKSNNVTQLAIKEFQRQGLIQQRKTGDVSTYSLDLSNNLTLAYLNLINEAEIRQKPFEAIKAIREKMPTEFFILLLFGSQIKGTATKKSDLDIAIIVESEQAKKNTLPVLETIKRREIIKIDYHVFTRKEYLEMLKAENENLGKQIYTDNVVYYGYIAYCKLIMRNKR